MFYRLANGPIHPGSDVARGTLRRILRDAGVTAEEFEKLR